MGDTIHIPAYVQKKLCEALADKSVGYFPKLHSLYNSHFMLLFLCSGSAQKHCLWQHKKEISDLKVCNFGGK